MECRNLCCDCDCTCCIARLLPFSSISELEFRILGNSVGMDDINYVDYFSPSKLIKIASDLHKNDFFLLHFNVRSLPKNKDKVEEFFNGMSRIPDAIAISETKLNANSVTNVNIPNYTFLRKDSPTNAGGVGLYTGWPISHFTFYKLNNFFSINIFLFFFSEFKNIILVNFWYGKVYNRTTSEDN